MTFPGVHLVISCDDLDAGSRAILGFPYSECPSWCLVTTDAAIVRKVPNTLPVIQVRTSDRLTAAQMAYEERRARGYACGIDIDMVKRIADWKRRREERFAQLIAEYVEENQTAETAPGF